MKRILTLILFAFIGLQVSAQSGLDNLGFENWGENNILGNPQPSGLGSIGQSENTTDPIEGGSALELSPKEITTPQGPDTIGASILGNITMSGLELGTDYTQCPDSLTGHFRYQLPNQDSGLIIVQVWNATDTLSTADTLVGDSISSWTTFNIPFNPMDCMGMTPDSIAMIFSAEAVVPQANINKGTQTVQNPGSFELDGLKLWAGGTPSSISDLKKDRERSFSVRPNPARKQVRFEFGSIAERIRIYDMTGRNVKSVELDQSSYRTVDVSGMEEGLYIYRVEDRNGKPVHSDKLQVIH